MAERLFQRGFDDHFHPTDPHEVTPAEFAGLWLPHREPRRLQAGELAVEALGGRFVREATAPLQVRCPADVATYLSEHIFAPFTQVDQEELWVLLLNTRNVITHEVLVYRGTVNSSLVRPAEILKEAIRVNAPAVVMSHSHPSGDPEPSPEDVRITEVVHLAAQMLGIDLLDHIVMGKERWVSLKEKGLGFEDG